MKRIMFVCHGNICRSPMAEIIFRDMVKKLGKESEFVIASRATSTEELGNPPHRGTVRKLSELGIPIVPHRATQIEWSDYTKYDYIIGMDDRNIKNLHWMLKGDPDGKVHKFLTFAGSKRDIADPWYTGNFDDTYNDVLEGCEGFLNHLKENGKI